MEPNRRTRRGAVIPLALAAVLIANAAASAQQTQRQYLSGTDRDTAVPWDFLCTSGRQSGTWTTIPVPSCWDMKGFGTLQYYKDRDVTPAEQGKYRHAFAVPAEWRDRRVFLVFDGAMTDTEATVNGKPVGPVHQGGFTRFKYDVTDLVRAGAADNLLEVTVTKKSADESVNRAERTADYWLFGGLFRPVYLEAVPREYVQRVAIDARADGAFAIDVFTPAVTSADATLDVEVRDAGGAVVATATGKPDAAAGKAARLTTRASNVSAWTAESPTLYTARVRLRAGDKTLHEVTQRFAFRTVEVRVGDGLYVNGSRVVLKGACRHAFWPDSGRTLSPTIDRGDIELMKSMNMNAVRMSHYPPDESFLDLCDELGLYVLDELPGWQKSYDPGIGAKMLAEFMVRDVNHPSIVLWDNGNEGGWQRALDDHFADYDPQERPVMHPWELHGGINTKHYPNWALMTQLLAGRDVVMPTEFLHGLYDGGAGAGLRDYWGAIRASKVGAGGFIWALLDEGVDHDGRVDVAGNAAPDGILGPYRQKEGSYFAIKELWSPVALPRELPADFDGTIAVENRYDFTPLDRVRFHWQLRKWNAIDDAKAGFAVIAEGDAPAPAIAAGRAGTLRLDLPSSWRSADALAVSVTDWTGRDVWTSVWPVTKPTSFAPPVTKAAVDAPAGAGELRSGDVVLTVDAATGALRAVTVKGKPIAFANGPRLALGTVAPPEPPRRPRSTSNAAQAASAPTTTPTTHAPAATGKLLSAKWAAAGDGWFRLAYSYSADGPCDFAGVTFDAPEQSFQSVRWLGDGPYRVWKNRLDGVTLGVWENARNDTTTGFTLWQYPEFKGYFANLHWATLRTDAGTITLAPETPGLYLRLGTPASPGKDLVAQTGVAFPDGNVSLLHLIPPIGTKFNRPDTLGPMSQPNAAHGTYAATVWLRFGP